MLTTLKDIDYLRDSYIAVEVFDDILRGLGKTELDDEPLPIRSILGFVGLADTVLCLRNVCGYDTELRAYALWCLSRTQREACWWASTQRLLEDAMIWAGGRDTSGPAKSHKLNKEIKENVDTLTKEFIRVLDCIDAGVNPYHYKQEEQV
jgi:hypothetical protein